MPESSEPHVSPTADALEVATTPPTLARGPHEVEPADVRSAVFMGLFFVGSILAAVVLADALEDEVEPILGNPDNVANPIIYLLMVVAFTAVILVVVKLGLKRFIRYFILGAVLFTMAYVYQPILAHYVPALGDWSYLSGFVIAIALTLLLYFYPEWYVVDAAGVSVAAGATGLFGFSFGIVPALILVIAFAIYDFVAVYRTKHMLDLADTVLDLRLPVMLVVPKVRGYSFLGGERLYPEKGEGAGRAAGAGGSGGAAPEPPQESKGWEGTIGPDMRAAESGEHRRGRGAPEPARPAGERQRDALFMGLGDIVIPGVLVVSSFVFLADRSANVASVAGLAPHLFVALATLVGATVGFFFLMRSVLRGTPHAGLPALCGGALVMFLATTLWLYGTEPLVPKF